MSLPPHFFLSYFSLFVSLLRLFFSQFPFLFMSFSSLLTGGFIIRIFSTAPIVVELVANLFHVSKTGDWKRTSEVPYISAYLVSSLLSFFFICILLNSIIFNIGIYLYFLPFFLTLVLVILYFLFFLNLFIKFSI